MPQKTTPDKGGSWADTVSRLEYLGLLTDPVEVAPTVYAVRSAEQGWGAIAREAAISHGGTFLPLSGPGGVRWGVGSRMQGLILPASLWSAITRAREVVRQVVAPPVLPVTLGGCARALLTWVHPPCVPCAQAERFLLMDDGRDYQYHDCQPGTYPHLTMYDCHGYYFAMMRRAPGLSLTVYRDGLQWDTFTPEQAAKWRDVLEAVWDTKVLRNSLYGCALGSRDWQIAYTSAPPSPPRLPAVADRADLLHWHKYQSRVYVYEQAAKDYRPGDVRPQPIQMGYGPFRTFGLLIARSGSELCQRESYACDSVYSTVDSVTCRPGDAPRVWEQYGFSYGVKRTPNGRPHDGKGYIVRRGSWRIGKEHMGTDPYRTQDRTPVPVPRWPHPRHTYADSWLLG